MVRPLLALLALLCVPAPTAAGVRIVSVAPGGPVVEGQPVDLVVQTSAPVDSARLTFPDLHGAFGATLCSLDGNGSTRTVLRYRPGWAGSHSLQVSVTAGACGLRAHSTWRIVDLLAAPATVPAPPARPGCHAAADPPVPRTMRSARQAVVCLLNRERGARGLPPLRADERLRRLASLAAHRTPRRARRGEQRTVTPNDPPATVVAAWLANEGHRRDLLDPAVRRVGVAVVPRFPEPLRRPETTYVVQLG